MGIKETRWRPGMPPFPVPALARALPGVCFPAVFQQTTSGRYAGCRRPREKEQIEERRLGASVKSEVDSRSEDYAEEAMKCLNDSRPENTSYMNFVCLVQAYVCPQTYGVSVAGRLSFFGRGEVREPPFPLCVMTGQSPSFHHFHVRSDA